MRNSITGCNTSTKILLNNYFLFFLVRMFELSHCKKLNPIPTQNFRVKRGDSILPPAKLPEVDGANCSNKR